jgi:hypothetical protein
MHDLGFILTRHVRSEETNQYWIESCRCIRRFYPDTPIVIIDDGSDPAFVVGDVPDNCTVIPSQYPRRGELLPYIFMKTQRLFKKAVILHDSVFLTDRLPLESVMDVKFLWNFTANKELHTQTVDTLCRIFPEGKRLLDIFHYRKWMGCFGVQSVITLDFLDTLPLDLLIDHIDTREQRCALERIFALLCQIRLVDRIPRFTLSDRFQYNKRMESVISNLAIYGRIHDQEFSWGSSFDSYMKNRRTPSNGSPIKVWTGR